MSPISVSMFTVTVIALVVLLGNFYSSLHVGRETWMIITIVTAALFVLEYIVEKTVFRKKSEE
ncbi:MAG: hypothetical protein JXA20_12265 [Spirochaetes bacterium]|nr:hypothetical protein [Spirochaetota bacterium]